MSDHITVIGNIATSPERRRTAAGDTVISFRLATNARYLDSRSGAWADGPTNFYTVSAYRRLAEHALDSLHLGERVIVSGKLRLREWESGEKKGVAPEIDADALGHDLKWGTSVFRSDGRGEGHSEDRSVDTPGEASTDSPREDIAAGGAEPPQPGDVPALVGAGAGDGWATPGASEDRPY